MRPVSELRRRNDHGGNPADGQPHIGDEGEQAHSETDEQSKIQPHDEQRGADENTID